MSDSKSELRRLRVEYKSLRDGYEILKQNVHANVDRKKEMRTEMQKFQKQLKVEKIEKLKKEVQ